MPTAGRRAKPTAGRRAKPTAGRRAKPTAGKTRVEPTAGKTRAEPTAGKTRAEPTAGKANQRTANRDQAEHEEKHSRKESCSQPVPHVQQGQYELKLGEVITTITAISFNEETVE